MPVSKRQAFAAYDPRVIRGYGLTWERGPMGADHTSGSAATYIPTMTPEQQADLFPGSKLHVRLFHVPIFLVCGEFQQGSPPGHR